MKLFRILLALMLIFSASAQAAVFTADAGNTFSFEREPENAAVLFSSFAEIYCAAGGEVKITVQESVDRGFAPEDAYLVDRGAGKQINTELLIAVKPDIVICSMDIAAQAEAAQLLNTIGIPAAQFRVECFDDYLRVLKIMCEITGDRENYIDFGENQRAEIEKLLAESKKSGFQGMNILFVRAGSSPESTKAKASGDHFAAQMLKEMGCVNIADKASAAGTLSMEAILAEDPDYIFFSMMGNEEAARANIESMLSGDLWSHLTAVREGRYEILPRDMFHFKPNMRWAEAYRYLYNVLQGGSADEA